ncbi:Rrf2 family transcriptional regulator [Nonomuraea deserti]|uniref:Rrf2 family transcriptional regulator n=1 Tax=Nonomuraea deserti TaxID=1848322 RepID=UPI001FE5CFB5|nr:Rrf2 family transcriptional regulator [Nonomuraea deserti]
MPRRFCDNILLQLRRAGLIHSQRGPDGGYWLARPASAGRAMTSPARPRSSPWPT